MFRTVSRTARLLALTAAASLTATPVLAADVYVPVILDHAGAVAAASPASVVSASQHRSWGGWGGRRHHDDVSVGDVLTGVLIIGGIAAIASAATKNNRERADNTYRYPDTHQRTQDGSYGEPVPQAQWGADRNIDRAVDSCVNSVERGDVRVDSVDNVQRQDDGWRVSGRMASGSEFSCSVDRDGNLRGVAAAAVPADRGYDGTGEDDRPEYPG